MIYMDKKIDENKEQWVEERFEEVTGLLVKLGILQVKEEGVAATDVYTDTLVTYLGAGLKSKKDKRDWMLQAIILSILKTAGTPVKDDDLPHMALYMTGIARLHVRDMGSAEMEAAYFGSPESVEQ